MKNNNQSFFNTFYLSGGSAHLKGLSEFITSNLNVKIEIFDPLKNIKNNNKTENICKYVQALGLALRGIDE